MNDQQEIVRRVEACVTPMQTGPGAGVGAGVVLGVGAGVVFMHYAFKIC